jgi:hypothetical protein
MAEIDLIPADYRRYLHLRWMARGYTILFSILVFSVAAGRMWTGHLLKMEKAAIKELEASENLILGQSKQFEDLTAKKSHLKTRLEALDVLRGGPPAEQMFVVISRAINPSTWITHWKFVRAGEVQEEKPTYRRTGYYVAKPKGENGKKNWREQTYMEIKGQTLNHSALADFVKKLLEQPIIDGIHELKTWTRAYKSGQIIEYHLAVTITSIRDGL